MDVCEIYHSGRERNVYFESNENTHYYEELKYKTPHVIMWNVLNARLVIGYWSMLL